MFNQIKHSAWAKEKQANLYSFRCRSGHEVDFIVEINDNIFAIEVKASDEINSEDLHGLNHFNPIMVQKHLYLFLTWENKNPSMEIFGTSPGKKV